MEEGYHLFKFGRLFPAKPASSPDSVEVTKTTTTTDVIKDEKKMNIEQPQTSSVGNIRSCLGSRLDPKPEGLSQRLGNTSIDTKITMQSGRKPELVSRLRERMSNTSLDTPLSMRLGPKPILPTSISSQSTECRQKSDELTHEEKQDPIKEGGSKVRFKRIEWPADTSKFGTQMSETARRNKRSHSPEVCTSDRPFDRGGKGATRFEKRSRKFDDKVSPLHEEKVNETKEKSARFDRFLKFDNGSESESD